MPSDSLAALFVRLNDLAAERLELVAALRDMLALAEQLGWQNSPRVKSARAVLNTYENRNLGEPS